MCTKSIDCPTCNSIETCAAVLAAFPTKAEEAAAKRQRTGRPTIYQQRVRPKVAAGVSRCSAPGCRQPNVAHSPYCHEHRRQHMNAWRERRRAHAH